MTTDNYNAGVKSLKDLKGKRIGITQKGSTFHYMLGRMLETQGMSLNDVEIVPLSKLSAVMAALESKQIDGCILNEPNITKVQKQATANWSYRLATLFLTKPLLFSTHLTL